VKAYSGSTAIVLTATTAAGSYSEAVTGLSGAAAANYVLAGRGNTLGTVTIAAQPVPPMPTVLIAQGLLRH